MKIFKIILSGLLVLIVIVLITALFVRKEYIVTREVVIDRPIGSVFDFVKHIKNQDLYNKWVMTDPAMKKTFSGKDGTMGFRYDWDGNDEAGQGEQEITDLVENKKVEISIHFIRPFEGNATNTITTDEINDNKTKVVSLFQSKVAYPMNFMLLLVDIDGVMGKDLELTLQNLKRHLEK